MHLYRFIFLQSWSAFRIRSSWRVIIITFNIALLWCILSSSFRPFWHLPLLQFLTVIHFLPSPSNRVIFSITSIALLFLSTSNHASIDPHYLSLSSFAFITLSFYSSFFTLPFFSVVLISSLFSCTSNPLTIHPAIFPYIFLPLFQLSPLRLHPLSLSFPSAIISIIPVASFSFIHSTIHLLFSHFHFPRLLHPFSLSLPPATFAIPSISLC